MAAATLDIAQVADDIAKVLTPPSDKFIDTVKIPTESYKTPSDSNAPSTVPLDGFILESEHFTNLQLYMKTAIHLPKSDKDFDSIYPLTVFQDYLKKDANLYSFMRDTLVGINNHCYNFDKKTFGPMVTLAGQIANYGDGATTWIPELSAAIETLTDPNATFDKPEVKEALDTANTIIKTLGSDASDMAKKCLTYANELNDFRVLTERDEGSIKDMHRRVTAALPSDDKLNVELRQKMKVARDELNKIIQKTETAQQPAGARWYHYIPWFGNGLATRDTLDHYRLRRQVALIGSEYQKLFDMASKDMQITLRLRDQTATLIANVDRVRTAITKAIESLRHMHSAFSNLQTGLEDISKKMDNAKTWVNKSRPGQRQMSLISLKQARDKWTQIRMLAKNFQNHGLIMEKSLKEELEKPDTPPSFVDLMACTYGGHDVTIHARVLYNFGRDIEVKTSQPGFPLGWHSVLKTISILWSFEGEKRLFISKELTGDSEYRHYLVCGPISKSSQRGCVNTVINPRPKPANAPAQILAIVWGADEITDNKAYDYCYDKMVNDAKIRWTTENMGGRDTWSGNRKSGVVYFTVDGKEIRQTGGQEGDAEMGESEFYFS